MLFIQLIYFAAYLQTLFFYSQAAFIASKHKDGIIIASDGRGSLSKGLLVDVNEARDIYRLTDMTYLACISSHGIFECLLNDGKHQILSTLHRI